MAELAFSGIWLGQSSTTKTVTDTTRFLGENESTPDGYALYTGEGIYDYLTNVKGVLDDSLLVGNNTLLWTNDVGTLAGISASQLVTALPKGLLNNFEFSIDQSGVNTIINLETVLYCKDSSNQFDLELASTFSKVANAAFSAGIGNGALDTGTFTANRTYYIWGVFDAINLLTDIVISLSPTSPTSPGNYVYERLIGAFWQTNSPRDYNYVVPIKDIFNTEIIQTLPYDYISEISIDKESASTVSFPDYLEVKNSSNSYDIKNIADLEKDFTAAFAEGDSNGMLDTGSIADDTQYYIYAIKNPTNGAVEYLMSASAAAATFPSGYAVYKIIGFLKTLTGYVAAPSTDLYIVWSIKEKWDDKDRSISSVAKDNSIVTSAPTYEALFSGSGNTIKYATFDTGTPDHFVDDHLEYPHDGKEDMSIQLHGHLLPETTGAGNVVVFCDYIILSEGNAEAAAAPTRLTKTVAMPTVLGELTGFYFDWVIDPTIKAGDQISITCGRLSTDGSDTYTDKIAITTYGIHYLRNKNGTDLVGSDL